MRFRFTGTYTGGRTTINVGGAPERGGVTFEGQEPVEVENVDLVRRLTTNPEFEAVGLDEDDMSELRAAYTEHFGKKPYHGWSADELREKMNADDAEG